MVGYLPSLCSWWGRGWSRDEWGWNLRVGGVHGGCGEGCLIWEVTEYAAYAA